MSLGADLRILGRLLRGGSRSGETHADRMEAFYSGQARDYDAFRRRLLPGRAELIARLPVSQQAVVVDMGGGTGANLDALSDAQRALIDTWYIVDLSRSLLQVARERAATSDWPRTQMIEADASHWQPGRAVDLVVFSYSLTMMPDWILALEHARSLLKPGGHIAVVDFTVSRKYPPEGVNRHGFLTRNFWPAWFSWDNVFLNPDHLPYLLRRFEPVEIFESRTRLPFLPGSRVPWYRFIGRLGN